MPPGHSSQLKIIGQFSIATLTPLPLRVVDEPRPHLAELAEVVRHVLRLVAADERADGRDAERRGGVDHLPQVRVGGPALGRVGVEVVRVVRERRDLEPVPVENVPHLARVEPLDVDVRDARVAPPLAAAGRPAGDLEHLEAVRGRPGGRLLEAQAREGRRQEAELHASWPSTGTRSGEAGTAAYATPDGRRETVEARRRVRRPARGAPREASGAGRDPRDPARRRDHAVGAGVLSKATGVEVTADSLFQIGSITKVWTATLVMQLVDEGLLELDQPVVELLPGFRVADPEVTRTVTTAAPAHAHERHRRRRLHRHRARRRLPRAVRGGARRGRAEPPARCDVVVLQLGLLLAGADRRAPDRHDLGRGAPGAADRAARAPRDRDARRRRRSCTGRRSVTWGSPRTSPCPTTTWGLPRSAGLPGSSRRGSRDVLAFAQMHLSGGLAADGSARALVGERRGDDREAGASSPTRARSATRGVSAGSGTAGAASGSSATTARRSVRRPSSASSRRTGSPSRSSRTAATRSTSHASSCGEVFDRARGRADAGAASSRRPTRRRRPARVRRRYERTGLTTEVFEGAEGLVLRSTVTGPLAALLPEPVHEYALAPVEPGVFAIGLRGRRPGSPSRSTRSRTARATSTTGRAPIRS